MRDSWFECPFEGDSDDSEILIRDGDTFQSTNILCLRVHDLDLCFCDIDRVRKREL
jgi:hypothetical protein